MQKDITHTCNMNHFNIYNDTILLLSIIRKKIVNIYINIHIH